MGNSNPEQEPGAWLVGGGEMAKLIKTMDWSKTALGPMESWPQSLRTTVSLMQASRSPLSLAWGSGHVQIYNDGYWPICGDKHPTSMGQDYRECWASAFPVIGEAYAIGWSGRSAYLEKMRMFLDRYGFLEECWFTFSFSPITDETGGVAGLFHPVTELTAQMLSERRTKTLRDLAARTGRARTVESAIDETLACLAESPFDLPFAILYRLDDDGAARFVGQTGIAVDNTTPTRWPVAEVAATLEAVELALAGLELGAAVGPYPEVPRRALVLPIPQPGSDRPAAVMVVGASPRLLLDEAYRSFFDLVAAACGSAIANARAYEDERRKAEALAAADRAKTAFFSNVSHELRTPLTLILGPLEDALATGAGLAGEQLAVVHRNAARLLRLVNSLLDFSRLEAGAASTRLEALDLAGLTAGLAESFRSLMENAGLELRVACPPLSRPVAVDRVQWEKIVLNLISNAYKFTLAGSVDVALREVGDDIELTIADTGSGIAPAELPRLFERFHRIEGAVGRSFEGTGIGLALVHELVTKRGGRVRVASELGRGTTFVVTIGAEVAEIAEVADVEAAPVDAAPAPRAKRPTASPSPYVLEAARWAATPTEPVAAPTDPTRPRVLVADDSADIRDYVTRLLESHWTVEAVADGTAALARIRERPPDLVLSDVMMPGLDGFELLRAIRADPASRTIPFVLLSARAGEEAVVGGLDQGADDYLAKPFSSRELLGRVRAHLELAIARRQLTDAATELAHTRAELLADLERKNHELQTFSYSVSHDLRAPLRAIGAFSQALTEDLGDQLEPSSRRHLDRIRDAAKRMSQLIDDLLSLSRVERASLRRRPVDLSTMARRIGAVLEQRDEAHRVTLHVDDDLTAVADGGLIEIVLENLLGNAWKFTRLTPDAAVTFGRRRQGDDDVFYVVDNGVGFDPAHAERLFAPFQRLHSAEEFAGTGIGLATVKRIIERHGGRVWAEAQVGHGARFEWTLGPAA